MSFEYGKPKSASKQVVIKGDKLENLILDTMRTVSSIVGATLGPGGQPVLIERYEHGLPSFVTKDGVTVMRSLGFDESSQHCIMEAARDAAIRTASEAGDGTTTATVLAEALARLTNRFCKGNPRVSPQKVVRRLEEAFREVIAPTISKCSIQANLGNEESRILLRAVAKVSANGDEELADAVMKCFDIVGDDGNVTISESSGPSSYEVEKIEGYPIAMGYEDSCGKFATKFVNDTSTQSCVLNKPVFICYFGKLTEFQTVQLLLERIGEAYSDGKFTHNVVIIATGFSENVLATLAVNFAHPGTLNIFPLVLPQSPLTNSQMQLLEDICAVTGAKMFDPLNYPLNEGSLYDLGSGVKQFEASRFRSSIVGRATGPRYNSEGIQVGVYEDDVLERVSQLQVLASRPESELDKAMLDERIGKLTGGIARLKVIGASNGELKEKRDRAEDAVCAVRGAIKHGCLPGGGWMLLKLMAELAATENADPIKNQVVGEVLIPALFEPVARLLANCGINEDEGREVLAPIIVAIKNNEKPIVYDALEQKHVDPYEGGILDSLPAVLEAVRNSISIAALLGTLGGIVVFKRDAALELGENRAAQQFLRESKEVD